MHKLGADVILATDDGFNYWSGGLWSADSGVPLLVVNHATAEFPGMQAMAGYLSGKFPDILTKYLPVVFPYSALEGISTISAVGKIQVEFETILCYIDVNPI